MLELGGICKAGKTRILGSQATEKRCVRRTVGIGVLSVTAPRDTFTGVGVGRKTGSEAGEAIRWGHFVSGRPSLRSLQSSTCSGSGFRAVDSLFSKHPRPLALEYDGGYHRENLTSDNRRQNRLVDAGYRLLRLQQRADRLLDRSIASFPTPAETDRRGRGAAVHPAITNRAMSGRAWFALSCRPSSTTSSLSPRP